MKCSNCGQELRDTDTKCFFCDTPVNTGGGANIDYNGGFGAESQNTNAGYNSGFGAESQNTNTGYNGGFGAESQNTNTSYNGGFGAESQNTNTNYNVAGNSTGNNADYNSNNKTVTINLGKLGEKGNLPYILIAVAVCGSALLSWIVSLIFNAIASFSYDVATIIYTISSITQNAVIIACAAGCGFVACKGNEKNIVKFTVSALAGRFAGSLVTSVLNILPAIISMITYGGFYRVFEVIFSILGYAVSAVAAIALFKILTSDESIKELLGKVKKSMPKQTVNVGTNNGGYNANNQNANVGYNGGYNANNQNANVGYNGGYNANNQNANVGYNGGYNANNQNVNEDYNSGYGAENQNVNVSNNGGFSEDSSNVNSDNNDIFSAKNPFASNDNDVFSSNGGSFF